MWKTLLWGLLIAVGVLLVGALTLVVLAVEDESLLPPRAEFTADHIFRAKALYEENNPRLLRSGDVKDLELSQDDLNLLLNYLAARTALGNVEVHLDPSLARIALTLRLPDNPIGAFLNVQADLAEGNPVPHFQFLQVGRVPLPGFVGDWLVSWGLHQPLAGGTRPLDLVREVHFLRQGLSVTYRWDEGFARQVKAAAVPADDQARWKTYQTSLAQLTGTLGKNSKVSLTQLLGPLLSEAKQRSAGGDPSAENRAVLVVLGAYLVGKGLDLLVSEAKDWPVAGPLVVTIDGRDDFPKHFAISAAMAAAAGSSFSDAVGVYKELRDSRGGSGFSFNDLASDRAGTRFGELAVGPHAVRLQELAGAGLLESDFFPSVQGLPEFLPEDQFLAEYGGTGGAAYKKMAMEIERRVEALPLLQ